MDRREVVAELAGSGMSNVAIADVIGVSDMTVHRDIAASTNVDPDRKVTGQDGKQYPKPSPPQPQPTTVVDDVTINTDTGEVLNQKPPPG